MRLVGAISTAILSLTLGVAAPAYAQQEQHDQQQEQKAKPEHNDKQARPEKPSKQQEEKSAQQERNTKPEEKKAQPEWNSKPEERNAQQQHNQQIRPEQQAQRAGGNNRGRIPDERFRANFGQQHRFRVNQSDYSNRHFQYGGYSFGFVDAWPSNWLYTQDVYVIEIDGVYYLCNPMYPGINIALSFTL